jgi:hypothetical protein
MLIETEVTLPGKVPTVPVAATSQISGGGYPTLQLADIMLSMVAPVRVMVYDPLAAVLDPTVQYLQMCWKCLQTSRPCY